MTDEPRRVIRASEVGQYTYPSTGSGRRCARAWWLGQIQGLESANIREMAQGEQAHAAHGELVAGYHRARRLAYMLLLLAALIGALLLVQLGVL
ncbi:MAG: hypothetical protein ACE5F6_12570 [Anaerolineae bacterium]